MTGAFSGLNAIDLTEGFAGALCTMVLADNGASVVRYVAPPGRSRDPSEQMGDGWQQWHRSKDIRPFESAAETRGLIGEADIVVISSGGVVAESLGLDPAQLAAANPSQIVCAIDGFDPSHPTFAKLPAYEGLASAVFGRMVEYGRANRIDRPIYVAPPLAHFGAGHAAFHAICAALHRRQTTGRGEVVSTNLLRGLTAYDFWGPQGQPLAMQRGPLRPGDPPPHPMLGYATARTKDGKWLQFANWAPHLLWFLLESLGLGDLRDDPECAGLPVVSHETGHRIWERMLHAVAQRTAEEWMAQFRASGVAGCDVLGDTNAGMDHPQIRHNGDVITVGATEQIGPIAQLGITGSIGFKPWNRPEPLPTATASGARPPLDGVVLIEAASMIATPVGSLILADLGARVIKVEPIGGEPGRTLPFYKTLLGKESICVDLKSRAGLEVVHRLSATADMFLHNYRPGVPEKLGIDYETLRACNERLIYVYAGAYGSSGPYAKMPGYHPIAGAVCGNAVAQAGAGALDRIPRDLDELKAMSLHFNVSNEGHPDPVTGLVVASTLLLALVGRDRMGRGQDITVSMLGANALLMSDDWIRFPGRRPRPEVDGGQHGTGPYNRLYRTADGWVMVCCPFADEQRSLREVLGAVYEGEIGKAFAKRGADEIEAACCARGLGVVRADRGGTADFLQAEIAAGRMSLSRREGGAGPWRAAALADMVGVDEQGAKCEAGQHTRSILAELGYETAAIDELYACGHVR